MATTSRDSLAGRQRVFADGLGTVGSRDDRGCVLPHRTSPLFPLHVPSTFRPTHSESLNVPERSRDHSHIHASKARGRHSLGIYSIYCIHIVTYIPNQSTTPRRPIQIRSLDIWPGTETTPPFFPLHGRQPGPLPLSRLFFDRGGRDTWTLSLPRIVCLLIAHLN